MAKQSVIKDIKVSDFNGKKSYTAVLEDGTTGYYDPKKCGEHEKGELVEYTVEEYTSKAGKKSNILTLAKVVSSGAEPAKEKKEEKEKVVLPPELAKELAKMKYESLVPVADIVMKGVINGKVEADLTKFREWYNGIIDDIYASIDDLRW